MRPQSRPWRLDVLLLALYLLGGLPFQVWSYWVAPLPLGTRPQRPTLPPLAVRPGLCCVCS